MCSVTAIRFIICRPQSLKKKETGRNKLVSFWCHVFCFPDSFTHPRVKHAFNDPNKEEPAVVTTRYQNSPQNKGRRSTSEKTLLDRSRLGMKFCSDSEGLTALMDGCVGGACSGSAPRPRRPATHCHPRTPRFCSWPQAVEPGASHRLVVAALAPRAAWVSPFARDVTVSTEPSHGGR